MEIECPRHGITDAYKNGKRWRCKKCRTDAVNNARRQRKLALIEYKGGKCEVCGYDKCVGALEFHHKDRNEKSYGIAKNSTCRSLDEDKKEVDKCLLLCANCHREIHYIEIMNRIEEYNKLKQSKQYEGVSSILTHEILQNCINDRLTIKDIATKYNVSVSSVKRYLKKYNIKREISSVG